MRRRKKKERTPKEEVNGRDIREEGNELEELTEVKSDRDAWKKMITDSRWSLGFNKSTSQGDSVIHEHEMNFIKGGVIYLKCVITD